jgi:hypothetical protein
MARGPSVLKTTLSRGVLARTGSPLKKRRRGGIEHEVTRTESFRSSTPTRPTHAGPVGALQSTIWDTAWQAEIDAAGAGL